MAAKIVFGILAVFLGIVLISLATPDCGPGEVLVNGGFGMVCVVGHH